MSESPSLPSNPELVYYPAPVLREQCREVTQFDDELRVFCDKMLEGMERWKGVGLAAPQVGVALRIFVTNHTGGGEDTTPDRRVWINPKITLSGPSNDYEEGCLSIPGIYAKVERPSVAEVTWQDVTGLEHSARFDSMAGEFLAVVIQHEYDHLDGILFLDHVSPTHLALQRRKLKDMEKAYRKEFGSAGTVLRR
ncbi:MAG: peptide deformylase [Planctomycetota bacterium]|jgi:peptide deformylase|nr:peptide deformylase [Planctomycetota bacterium]